MFIQSKSMRHVCWTNVSMYNTFLNEKLRKTLADLETEKYWHHPPQHTFEMTKCWQQDCVLDHLEGQQILLCSDELWKHTQLSHNTSCVWISPQHTICSYPSLFTKSISFHFAARKSIRADLTFECAGKHSFFLSLPFFYFSCGDPPMSLLATFHMDRFGFITASGIYTCRCS